MLVPAAACASRSQLAGATRGPGSPRSSTTTAKPRASSRRSALRSASPRLARAHPQHALEHDARGLRRGGVEGVGAVGHGDATSPAPWRRRGVRARGRCAREEGGPAISLRRAAREAAAEETVELVEAGRAAGRRGLGRRTAPDPGTEVAQRSRGAPRAAPGGEEGGRLRATLAIFASFIRLAVNGELRSLHPALALRTSAEPRLASARLARRARA